MSSHSRTTLEALPVNDRADGTAGLRSIARDAGINTSIAQRCAKPLLIALILGEVEPADCRLGADAMYHHATINPETGAPTAAPSPATPRPTFRGSDSEDPAELMRRAVEAMRTRVDPADLEALSARISAADGRIDATNADLEKLAAAVAQLASAEPKALRVQMNDNPPGKTIQNPRPELTTALRLIAARPPHSRQLWFHGPAGSGKSTLGRTVAEALGLRFGAQSFNLSVTSASLIGSMGTDNVWHEPSFIDYFENGGVYLLDEFDSADPSVPLVVNDALANGLLYVPRHHDPARRIIQRHRDCVVIAAGNTVGLGADASYTGRSRQDLAVRDRFAGMFVRVDYWEALERGAFNPEHYGVYDRLTAARATIAATSTATGGRYIGTRLVLCAADLMRSGMTEAETLSQCFSEWSAADRAKIGVN